MHPKGSPEGVERDRYEPESHSKERGSSNNPI